MLIHFLEALDESGRVPTADEDPAVDASARAWLKERYDRLVLELAGPPLPFDADAAAWGAVRLYQGCRFLTYRHEGPNAIGNAFSGAGPKPTTPALFSVDLVLRHLPDLWKLSGSLPDDDPLLAELKRLAAAWPLSSIGVPNVEGFDLAPIFAHPGLRQLYTDRALRLRDRARLRDPAVLAAAREAVGDQAELQGLLTGL